LVASPSFWKPKSLPGFRLGGHHILAGFSNGNHTKSLDLSGWLSFDGVLMTNYFSGRVRDPVKGASGEHSLPCWPLQILNNFPKGLNLGFSLVKFVKR
jgi:hypothetical protein